MTVREAIITLAEENFLSQEKLGYRLNKTSKGYVYKLISREAGMNMKVSTLLKLLDALNAQLVVQSIESETEVIIDGEFEGVGWTRAEQNGWSTGW
nr:MAG TPA: epoxidase [Caudoviricetes sp.]